MQIHCHSQESDAKRGQTPAAVEEAYRDAGYSCVFLTDHNRITPGPGVPGILHIDSAEYGLGRHHTLALGTDRPAAISIAGTTGEPRVALAKTRCHRADHGLHLQQHPEEAGPYRREYERAIPVAAHPMPAISAPGRSARAGAAADGLR